MPTFRKNKTVLLKELRDLITTGLEKSEDRRQSRKLRYMRREVDSWIKEIKEANVQPIVNS